MKGVGIWSQYLALVNLWLYKNKETMRFWAFSFASALIDSFPTFESRHRGHHRVNWKWDFLFAFEN